MSGPKVAIVHDWMLMGGAEKVVAALLDMYPDAPLYTSAISNQWQQKLADRDVVTGYLNSRLFVAARKFVPFLRQRWFENLDLSYYDIVISSSGAEAKGIQVSPNTLHVNYCHAPTHYYWSRYDEYIKNPGFGKLDPIARIGLRLLLAPMRKWDLKASKRPDVMLANSTYTAESIKKYYGREAQVVFPPVDISRFSQNSGLKERDFFLAAGRQTPYKRFDLAVAAATKLGLPLVVAGDGPDHDRLVSMAGPTVKFETRVSDARMNRYFANSKAFIFAGTDDFGITPIEALASGTPVVAFKAGGALDYVIPNKTGVFFEQQTAESLAEALTKAGSKSWNYKTLRQKANKFSEDNFKKSIQKAVESAFLKKFGFSMDSVVKGS